MKQALVAVFMLAMAVSGCNRVTAPARPPAGLTPTQTLERFFTALNAGDLVTVAALHSRSLPDDYVGNVKSVRLLQVGPGRIPDIPSDEYKARLGIADATVLWAEFDIQFYREESMTNGRHSWNYILIKRTADGPWLIHDWGH
jgi:hypothetical protein